MKLVPHLLLVIALAILLVFVYVSRPRKYR